MEKFSYISENTKSPSYVSGKALYDTLHNEGVTLKDEDIEWTLQTVLQGVSEALEYFQAENSWNPNWDFLLKNTGSAIGYNSATDNLGVTREYLNNLAERKSIRESSDLTEIYGESVSIWYYLKTVGREETAHHFQKIGHPLVKTVITPDSTILYDRLKATDRLCCDVEVEARNIGDAICIQKNEKLIWTDLEKELQRRYPKRYGKTVEWLVSHEDRNVFRLWDK